jgi:transposase
VASDKKRAVKRGAKLAFLDESGFSLQASLRRTWSPRGQTPIVHAHLSWERLNAIGALICNGAGNGADLHLAFQEETVKEEAIIGFLSALHGCFPGRIVLVWDHLQAHKSDKVAAYLVANRDWLQVEWFPSYASELNPMEYFWSVAKGEPTANTEPDTLDEIERSVRQLGDRAAGDQELLYGFLAASGLFPSKDERSLA